MKLSAKKLGLAMGTMLAFAMLVLSFYPWLAETLFDAPEKGTILQGMMENIYPWFDHTTALGILAGVVFGFLDGFIFAFLLGSLYNLYLGE